MNTRRASGEVIAIALLLAITAAVMASVVTSSKDRLTSAERTLAEKIDVSSKQLSELVVPIGFQRGPEGIWVELLNYGKHPVKIKKVLVDGVGAPFEVTSYGNVTGKILPPGRPVVITTPVAGSTLQIVTQGGNLLDLP